MSGEIRFLWGWGDLEMALKIFRMDAASCNGCDIEILAALAPQYEASKLDIEVVPLPEEANVLVVTGPVVSKSVKELEEIYCKIQEPKLVVAIGQCANSKDVFHDSYNVEGPVDNVIPVNYYIPGCPPRPQAILHAIAIALEKPDFKAGSDIWNVPEGFRGKIDVDSDKCIGCEACVRLCPSEAIDAIEVDGEKTLNFNYTRCILCATCEEFCPEEAITLTGEYRLVTADRNTAFTKVELNVEKCSVCGKHYTLPGIATKGIERMLEKQSHYKQYSKSLGEAAKICLDCRNNLDNIRNAKKLLLTLNKASLSS